MGQNITSVRFHRPGCRGGTPAKRFAERPGGGSTKHILSRLCVRRSRIDGQNWPAQWPSRRVTLSDVKKSRGKRRYGGPLGKRKFSHAKRIELNEWLHLGQLTH